MLRWDEVRATGRHILDLLGGQLREQLFQAGIEYNITGSPAAIDALLARLTPAQREEPVTLYYRKGWAILRGDTAEFKRLDKLVPDLEDEEAPIFAALNAAGYLWSIGEKQAAADRLAPFVEAQRRQAESEPTNPIAQQLWGSVQFLTGHVPDGLATLEAVTRLMPTEKDAMDGPNYEYSYLESCAQAGDKEKVLARMPALLRMPTLYTPASIRLDPAFAGLRGDPRWEAILADPANLREPLY